MNGGYVQMMAALVALASMAGVFLWMARKKQRASGLMSVMAYQPIGQKSGVAALKVGGEILILGVSQSDLKVLKTMKESDLRQDKLDGAARKFERLRKLKEGI